MKSEKTIEDLARLLGGVLYGDKKSLISDVASIDDAKEGEITFIDSLKKIKLIKDSLASAFIVPKEAQDSEELTGRNIIAVDEPYIAFARVIDILRPHLPPEIKISPKADISPGAKLGSNITIEAFAVIETGVLISDNVVIYPGVYIARGVRIGERTVIHSNVSIREDTWIGDDVIIHANSVIGSDGFGYIWDKDRYLKIPQRGSVRIENDSEIGACVTIDRGTIGETIIGRGTKIDNLSQIAHNVEIGEHSIIVSQTGIAGSTKIGKRVQIGGQAGLIGHIKVGDDARVAARAVVLGDVAPGTTVSGFPAMPHNLWLRVQSLTKKLPDMKSDLKNLEERLKRVENNKKESS